MTGEVVPRPFRLLTIAVLSTAGVVLHASASVPPGEAVGLLFAVALLAWVSENFAPTSGGYSISMALPLSMGSLLLLGPSGAALVAAASSLNLQARKSARALWTSLFNLGQLVLAVAAAGLVYGALSGPVLFQRGTGLSPLAGGDFPSALLPLLTAAAMCAVLNVFMTALGVHFLGAGCFSDLLRSTAAFLPSFLALSTVGYMAAQVVAVDVAGLLLFAFPLAVSGRLYQRFTALRDSYDETANSLVSALEAKDDYTSGHSERVARLCAAIAEAQGMDRRKVEDIRRAALLHDVGKLGLPMSVLRKRAELTEAEWALVRQHPTTGADMVSRIPALSHLARSVAQHHERLDGTGYPEGDRGEAVTRIARILAVADAYDAMTSSRPYRCAMSPADAQAELRRCAHTQFDPSIVELLCAHVAAVEPAVPTLEVDQDSRQATLGRGSRDVAGVRL